MTAIREMFYFIPLCLCAFAPRFSGSTIKQLNNVLGVKKMPLNIRAVIFDLGRVLIKVDFTRGLFRYRNPSGDKSDQEVLEELFADPVFVDFNTGRITPQETFRLIKTKYNLPIDYPVFVAEWSNIFAPMEGMEKLLTDVAGKFPVGLLSDIDPLHWAYCQKHYPFLQVFKKPALSFEIGALKPAEICYKTAARNVSTAPENCLFIDDRQINVDGAIHAGMQSIRFTDAGSLYRDLEIRGIL